MGKGDDSGLLCNIELDELGSWIEETLNSVSSDCGFSINDSRPTLPIDLKNIRDFADVVNKMSSASKSTIHLLLLISILLIILVYNHLSGIAQRLSSSLVSEKSGAVHAGSRKDELLALVLEAMVRMRLPQDHDQLLELYTPARKSKLVAWL